MRFNFKEKEAAPSNSGRMLGMLVAGMSTDDKKKFVENLDLEEPVSKLIRYEEADGSSGANLKMVAMASLIVETQDVELIEAMLAHPAILKKKTYFRNRDFDDALKEMPEIILKAALGESDVKTLCAAEKKFGSEKISFAGRLTRGFDDVSENICAWTSHADRHSLGKAREAFGWISDRRKEQIKQAYGQPRKVAERAAHEKLLAKSHEDFCFKVLNQAARDGSRNASQAIMDSGESSPSYFVAGEMFVNGSPGLAMWMIGLAKADRGAPCKWESEAGKSSHMDCAWIGISDRGFPSDKLASESKMLIKMARSLHELDESLERPKRDSQWDRDGFASIKSQMTPCIELALSAPAAFSEKLGQAQRELVSAVMSSPALFHKHAQLVKTLASAYPLCMPSELVMLAKKKRWTLFDQRFNQALGEKPSVDWVSALGDVVSSEICASQGIEKWHEEMATRLAASPLAWEKNASPFDSLLRKVINRDERARLMGEFEKMVMQKAIVVPTAAVSKKIVRV